MKAYVLAIDIGTQGTKAALYDTELNQLATAFEGSQIHRPENGVAWQEASDIYASVVRTTKELVGRAKHLDGEIAAIGIDSQMAGIMGIGSDGEAVTYYDSWLDTQCHPYVSQMQEEAGNEIVQITGGQVTYTHGPKILWWKNERPEVYKQIAKFVLPHGYVIGKICGQRASAALFDHTCLHYSGFGDNEKKVWSKDLLDQFDVEASKLPEIASPFKTQGVVAAGFSALTGIASGVPVMVGAGDTAASIFGAGAFKDEELLDCAGTASVLSGLTHSYCPDVTYKTLTMMRAPLEGTWYPMAYVNGGGMCLSWFRDLLTSTSKMSYEALEAEAVMVSPGSDGLLFNPHFAGRVLPSQPALRGGFTGLGFHHRKGHLYRAIMEGIAYEYDYYLSVMLQCFPDKRYRLLRSIGGGAASELFQQIKSAVLGINAVTFSAKDTALIGSAAIAGFGSGLVKNYQELISARLVQKQEYHSNMVWEKIYAQYGKRYLKYIAGQISIVECLKPTINEEEILVETKAAAICGTDLRMIANGYQGVSEDKPLTLGHEFSGVVVECGSKVSGYNVGDKVAVAPNFGCGTCNHCVSGDTHLCADYEAFGINIDGAFAQYVRIPAKAVRQGNVSILSEATTFLQGAVMEPMSCVLNGQSRTGLRFGDTVMIIGAGPIGLMHAMLAKVSGAGQIIMSDLSQKRLEKCRELMPELQLLEEGSTPSGIDVCITACPSGQAQADALSYMNMNGRILYFGGLPAGRDQVTLNTNLIHYRQLSIHGSTRGNIRQYREVEQMIANGQLALEKIVTGTYRIEQFSEAIEYAKSGKGLKAAIVF